MNTKKLLFVILLSLPAILRGQTVVGDLASDYSGSVMSHGWTYLWSSKGPIGTSSNYSTLKWDSKNQNGQWDTNPESWPKTGDGSGWLEIRKPDLTASSLAGHPGEGNNAQGGFSEPKYIVLCFTLPDDGDYSIANSFITSIAPDSAGLQYHIYVNDSKIGEGQIPPGKTTPFNIELGTLKKADRVYVAIGAREGTVAYKDYFNISYQIQKNNP